MTPAQPECGYDRLLQLTYDGTTSRSSVAGARNTRAELEGRSWAGGWRRAVAAAAANEEIELEGARCARNAACQPGGGLRGSMGCIIVAGEVCGRWRGGHV
eukprot:2098769-Rhodomonas_salina.1